MLMAGFPNAESQQGPAVENAATQMVARWGRVFETVLTFNGDCLSAVSAIDRGRDGVEESHGSISVACETLQGVEGERGAGGVLSGIENFRDAVGRVGGLLGA